MLKGRGFRPGVAVSVIFALLLPVLLGLGFWQLERAAEKSALRDRYLQRGGMPPVRVSGQALGIEAMDFRHAIARGRYRAEWTVFLDNRVLDGRPGYEVLTPLAIDGGERYLLVNRGWVPWGESRRDLPRIDTPDGPVEVAGRLRAPPRDYFTLEDEEALSEFQPRWQNLDLGRYERLTGLAVSPLVLRLDPANDQGGGFARRWPQYQDSWIARHKGYAVQWFALALTLVVLYIVLNLKRPQPDHE